MKRISTGWRDFSAAKNVDSKTGGSYAGLLNKFCVVLGLALFGLSGCSFFRVPTPDAAHAVVSDHLVNGTAGRDYMILAVDGQPAAKEKIPFGVDLPPGAAVTVGAHAFKVSILPRFPQGVNLAQIVVFTARVEGKMRYSVGTADGKPVLLPWTKVGAVWRGPHAIPGDLP